MLFDYTNYGGRECDEDPAYANAEFLERQADMIVGTWMAGHDYEGLAQEFNGADAKDLVVALVRVLADKRRPDESVAGERQRKFLALQETIRDHLYVAAHDVAEREYD